MRNWLKELRTGNGLTMAQMAKKLDITESYYSLIENGERQKKMDIYLANDLASIFGIPVEQIVEFEAKTP